MGFLRAGSAGVAAAALLGLLLVAVGVDWDLAEGMRRERFFVLAVDALFCGWMAALIVTAVCRFSPRLQERRVSATFWCGAALALTAWSWIALLPAAILLFFALRGALPALAGRFWPAGALLHLAPLAVFAFYPAESEVLPLQPVSLELPPAAAPGPAVSAERPDVLLIVADTLRAEAILDPETPTPHLDALRARGTWAEYGLAPCNQTLPSHMVLFTGLDVEQLGMRSNDSRWPKAEQLRTDWRMRTLAERLRDAGWRTAGVAANVLLTSQPQLEKGEQSYTDGFELWHGMQRVEVFNAYFAWARKHTLLGRLLPKKAMAFPLTNLLNPREHELVRTHREEGERSVDLALTALEQLHAQPQPGFLFLNLFDPHAPYAAPPPFGGTIADPAAQPAGYPPPPSGELAMRVAAFEAFQRERSGGLREDVDAETAWLSRLYQEEVAYADAQLGRLFEAVKRKGRPTLIVFLGDHGEAFGEHRNLEHRWTLFEEEIRVPFILAGPGIPEGRQLAQVPELVDATRTLLERLGLDPAGVAGRNVLSSDEAAPRPPLTVMAHHAAIRDARWKLIATVSYGEDKDGAVFRQGEYVFKALHLFDLSSDQAERNDLLARELAPEPAAALERLTAALRARMDRDQFPLLQYRKVSTKQMNALAELGYADAAPAAAH